MCCCWRALFLKLCIVMSRSYLNTLDPDPYSEFGSGSSRSLNMDTIQIRNASSHTQTLKEGKETPLPGVLGGKSVSSFLIRAAFLLGVILAPFSRNRTKSASEIRPVFFCNLMKSSYSSDPPIQQVADQPERCPGQRWVIVSAKMSFKINDAWP